MGVRKGCGNELILPQPRPVVRAARHDPSDDSIILNTREPPLNNVKLRQALLIAMDGDTTS